MTEDKNPIQIPTASPVFTGEPEATAEGNLDGVPALESPQKPKRKFVDRLLLLRELLLRAWPWKPQTHPARFPPYQYTAEDLEELYRHRAHAREMLLHNTRGAENVLLTLSAAMLAFSLTFLKDLAQKPPVNMEWIQASWCLLGLTVMLTLLSYMVGIQACERTLCTMKEFYMEDKEFNNGWEPWVGRLNWAAFATFVLGFSLMISFALSNYSGNAEVGTRATSKASTVEDTKSKGEVKDMAEKKDVTPNVPSGGNHATKGATGGQVQRPAATPKPTPTKEK